MFEIITNYKNILNISFQLKYYLDKVSYLFSNRKVLQRTADVKSLYPSIETSDSKNAVSWLFHFVGYKVDFINGSIEIIDLVIETTFIFFEGRMCRLRDMIATGWSFATLLANVTLLWDEFGNKDTWFRDMLSLYFENKVLDLWFSKAICLHIEVRYIDDIYELWEFNMDILSESAYKLIHRLLRMDDGFRYNDNVLVSNIILKCKIAHTLVVLDLEIFISPISGEIFTTLSEKIGKLITYIDNDSNNIIQHFGGVWSSENFRSICFNDNYIDHKLFVYNLLLKLRERNWHPAMLRIIQKNCNLRYKHRKQYIYNIQRKLINKKRMLLYNYSKNVYDFKSFLSIEEYNFIQNTLAKQKEEIIKLYFKKECNRLYENDMDIRDALNNLISNLGLTNVKIILCNSVNQKLGNKILY